MKKLFLLITILSFSQKQNAQVVFCPPGAQWNYLFSGTIFWPGTTYNEPIIYVGDSIEGQDTLKVLSHNRSSLFCGVSNSVTLIKQKGDTIFFRNKITPNGWEILYNFAAQPGHTWQTTVLANGLQSKVFTTTVQAVGNLNINGTNLKTLSVNTTSFSGVQTITERFGAASFLFNFAIKSPTSCDGNGLLEFLCYQDSSFGLKKFGDKSCDFRTSNGVGLAEGKNGNRILSTYPNPVSAVLNLEFENTFHKAELSIVDVQGREVMHCGLQQKNRIDLLDLAKGIYFISVSDDGRLVFKSKLVKTE